jgi:transcriptional regulator with XRE-family HTH domain
MRAPPLNVALRVAIAATGRTQKDVARRAGINQWRLSRIVRNDVTPTAVERARLARILAKPVQELFSEPTGQP